jgi:periplasmic divalent cation tolerance protein
MTDKRLVLSTAGTREEAGTIAQELVRRRLAACVNIMVPIDSVYRWKGEVETSQEFLLLIKTTADQFAGLKVALEEMHSYEVPECICVAIEDGLSDYLNWIGNSVGVMGR